MQSREVQLCTCPCRILQSRKFHVNVVAFIMFYIIDDIGCYPAVRDSIFSVVFATLWHNECHWMAPCIQEQHLVCSDDIMSALVMPLPVVVQPKQHKFTHKTLNKRF